MNEFIQLAVSQLGVSEVSATQASEGFAGILSAQMDAGDFEALAVAVPGLEEMIPEAAASIHGALAGFLGGPGMAALSSLTESGIALDRMGPFLHMLFDFIGGKAGNDLVQKAQSAAPELAPFLNPN